MIYLAIYSSSCVTDITNRSDIFLDVTVFVTAMLKIFYLTINKRKPMVDSENRIIDFKEVQKLSGGYCRSSLWRLEKAGEFPKRIKLTPNGRKVGWKLSEILEWIESRCIHDRVSEIK